MVIDNHLLDYRIFDDRNHDKNVNEMINTHKVFDYYVSRTHDMGAGSIPDTPERGNLWSIHLFNAFEKFHYDFLTYDSAKIFTDKFFAFGGSVDVYFYKTVMDYIQTFFVERAKANVMKISDYQMC